MASSTGNGAPPKEESMDGLELVAEHCHEQLSLYVNCVGANPNSWQSTCEPQRIQLAACAESNPAINEIKVKCAATYNAYDDCLQAHPTDVKKCSQQLEKFADCADQIIGNGSCEP